MTAKPELRESLGIVVSSAFLGFVSTVFGGVTPNRRSPAPNPGNER
jgi:hypothetical protein